MSNVSKSNGSMALHDLVLGTDIVDLGRLKGMYERYGDRFLTRILSPEEIHYCQAGGAKKFLERLGGRIALKEATAKALGVGINGLGWQQGVGWQEIQVQGHYGQAPCLQLTGKAATIAQQKNIAQWRLSLSHDGAWVVATVIGLLAA